MGDLMHGLMDHSFEAAACLMAGSFGFWKRKSTGSASSDGDKKAVLAREVDFTRSRPEHFRFVYKDIASDKF